VFRLLGAIEGLARGRPLDFGPPQRRAVLAVLLAEIGRPVSAETLIDRVWGDRIPAGARRALHSHVARIRPILRAAGPSVTLVHRSGGYVVEADPDVVDWHRFRRLVTAAGSDRLADERRAALLSEALDLWQGVPLAGVPGDWAARTRESWEQLRLDATVLWAEAELRLGRPDAVISRLRDLVGEFPLSEPLAAALLRALLAAGRQAEALERYAAVRATLVEELGTEPGPALRQLYRTMLNGQPDRTTLAAGPVPAQLPPDVRGFAGRRDALTRLDEILSTSGSEPSAVVISAISGTAGVGKTALALRWAHRVSHRFPDGHLYLNLRGFHPDERAITPEEGVRALLDALDVPPERIPSGLDAQVGLYRSALSGQRVLIVLDNARDADQVRPLLPGHPGAVVVVTSRDRLTPLVAAHGAHALLLDPLSPVEARELLTYRLGAERVGAEREAVARTIAVCARLPLALTIVASRAQQTGFSLTEIADELCDVDRRLDVLDAGDATGRVRAAFAWSYTALSPPAARMFRLLGLHLGPDISAAAAASLAGQPLRDARRQLADLVAANLLTEHAPGRYTFHDLLRAYAAELVHEVDPAEEREAASARLLDHYAQTAHAASAVYDSDRDAIVLGPPRPGVAPEAFSDGAHAARWFHCERAAVISAIRRTTACGLDRYTWQLAWGVAMYLLKRGHLRELVDTQLAAIDAVRRLSEPVHEAAAHRFLGQAYTRMGQVEDAAAHLDESLRLYAAAGPDDPGHGRTWLALAFLSTRCGRHREALQRAEHALHLHRSRLDTDAAAGVIASIAWNLCELGQPDRAVAYCRQAIRVHKASHRHHAEAATWDTLGYAHSLRGNHAEAIRCYRAALAGLEMVGDRFREAGALNRLGDAHHAIGDHATAQDAWLRSLEILATLDYPEAESVRAKLGDVAGAQVLTTAWRR